MVCNELGYHGPAIATVAARFGEAAYYLYVPIWLSKVRCNGSEQHLVDCPSVKDWSEYAVKDCTHYRDAGVICQG